MVLWVELLTKQFNGNQEACEWFLTHMSTEFWWPVQILIKCPVSYQSHTLKTISECNHLRKTVYLILISEFPCQLLIQQTIKPCDGTESDGAADVSTISYSRHSTIAAITL